LFPDHEKHSLDEQPKLLDALGDQDVERTLAIALPASELIRSPVSYLGSDLTAVPLMRARNQDFDAAAHGQPSAGKTTSVSS
jgi:hypothetical protein